MKSPADTAEAHSESDDDEGPANTSPDVEAAEADPAEAVAEDARDEDSVESGLDDEVDEPEDPKGRGQTDKSKLDVPASDDEDDLATGRRRGRSAIRWIAAVVLVAVLAGAGYEGWLLFQQHQKDVAAAQALDAAKKFTLTLTTIDPNAIDKNIADVRDGSTGEFKDLYERSSAQLRQVLIENKAAAHGMVIEAAVKSATKNRVEVVLFVDQAVSNATAPAPQLDRSRVVMTMEKVDGRWLASKVNLP